MSWTCDQNLPIHAPLSVMWQGSHGKVRDVIEIVKNGTRFLEICVTTFTTMDTIFLEVWNSKGENLCFIEGPHDFIHLSLSMVWGDLDGELGDLLPREYKFCCCGFPMSWMQEEGLLLNACFHAMPANEVDICDVSSDYCLEIKEFMIKDSLETAKITCSPIFRSFRSRDKRQIIIK